jgi:hypothetical protein
MPDLPDSRNDDFRLTSPIKEALAAAHKEAPDVHPGLRFDG